VSSRTLDRASSFLFINKIYNIVKVFWIGDIGEIAVYCLNFTKIAKVLNNNLTIRKILLAYSFIIRYYAFLQNCKNGCGFCLTINSRGFR